MKHTCPCCGHRTHDQPVGGSMQICPVCFWEDAPEGLAWGNSNHVCLPDAQANFLKFGACEMEHLDLVRPATRDEERHPEWLNFEEQAKVAIRLIEDAFDGVRLGDGMSLHQREALDNYGSRQDFEAARRLDPEHRWQDIPDSKIEALGTTLAFLDPLSIRYHLPAFMRQMLRSWLETKSIDNEMVLYALERGPESSGYHADSFLLLNPEQKLATARFLQFIATVDWIHGDDARTSLDKGWGKYLNQTT